MAKSSPPKVRPQVRQTLAWARKQGFKPVVLNPQSKAAVSRDYTQVGYSPPEDDVWDRGDYGVGIVTGPAADGPVDVDLDCEEAVFFAPRFFPPTQAVFGRETKPSSHMVYKVSAPAMDKVTHNDPVNKGVTLLELRADGGHQTVFPGSVHQDTGEEIRWEKVVFPDVPVVDEEVLRKAARLTALACLISKYLWLDGQRNEVCKHLTGLFFYLEWPVEEIVLLVEALSEYIDDKDRSRVPTVRATYRKAEAGGKVTGATTLRKFCDNDILIDRILELAGSATINLLTEYNDRYAVVMVEGKFRIADLDVEAGEPPIFYQKDDFLNMTATDTIDLDEKKVSKARIWLANVRRRQYRSMDFLPGQDSDRVLNLWTGWSIQPSAGTCSGWMELTKEVICGGNEELYTWLLHWYANIVREPMKKSLTAPVLIGKQGAGKSLGIGYFGRVLGPAYTVITNEEHIYGRFNRHLATTLLLHSEEALYGGERKHRGIIKSLITDDFRTFEQKGIDAKQVKNLMRLILTSNSPHAAPAEAGDRRYTVIDLKRRMLSTALLKRVKAELDGDGPAALFQHLMTMDYDPMIPRVNVKNDDLRELKGINQSPLEDWWLEVLTNGQLLPDYLSWASGDAADPWPEVVSSVALYTSMVIYMRERGVRSIPNETLFGIQFIKFIGRPFVKKQRQYLNTMPDHAPPIVRTLNDRHNSITNMLTLDEARAAYCDYIGQDIQWPEPLAEEEKPAYQKYRK